jgi:hypothetical protein
MYVAIHHSITDPKKWDEVTKKIEPMIEQGKLPAGLKALSYLPSTDGRRADCLWEVDSLENLKRFLDPETSAAARNEYFQINSELAFGLPEFKQEQVAAR